MIHISNITERQMMDSIVNSALLLNVINRIPQKLFCASINFKSESMVLPKYMEKKERIKGL